MAFSTASRRATRERRSGVSFAYQVSTTLGAGSTLLVAASLLLYAGGPPNTIDISVFVTALCLLTVGRTEDAAAPVRTARSSAAD